jgi:hypothetical protein
VSLAALVGCPFWARPSHCATSALRVTLGWCDHVYPRWDGHTTDILQFPHVLGAPVSLIGSELSSLLGSDPSICLAPDAAGVGLCTHMMPGNTSILYLRTWSYRGGAMPNFRFTEFSEVRAPRICGWGPKSKMRKPRLADSVLASTAARLAQRGKGQSDSGRPRGLANAPGPLSCSRLLLAWPYP